MKRICTTWILLLIAVLVISTVSCSQRDKRIRKNITSILTPVSSGNPYEVMIVAEDSVYDGYVGKSILAVLETPMKGLPRDESSFKVSHITPAHYDRITNLFRNIIRIVVDPKEYTMAKFKLDRDVFSSPQTILTIQGPRTPNSSSTSSPTRKSTGRRHTSRMNTTSSSNRLSRRCSTASSSFPSISTR